MRLRTVEEDKSVQLSFNLIAEKLREKYPDTSVALSCGQKFRCAKAYCGAVEKGVIYVLLEDGVSAQAQRTDAPCICHARAADGFRYAVCVPDSADMQEVFNEVLSVFDRFAAWELATMEMIAQKKPLDQILDLSSMVTPNPIHLIDPSMRMIAHSHVDIMHEISYTFRQCVRTGYPPYEVLKRQIEDGEQEKLNKTRGVFHMNPVRSVESSYECRNIFDQDQLLAHIFVINIFTGPTVCGLEIADRLGDMLLTYLKDSAGPKTQPALTNILFQDLLSGTKIDNKLLSGALGVYKWHIEDCYRMVILRSMEANATQSFLAQLLVFPGSLEKIQVIFYQKSYVILFHETPTEDILELVTPLAEQCDIYVGIGKEFRGITQMSDYYKQLEISTVAGLTARPSQYVWSDDDTGLYYLLDQYTDMPLKQICHEGVYRLFEYDRRNGTDFVKILLTYMECSCNRQKAANILYIHRNTMNNYLNKIASMLEFDNLENEKFSYVLFSLHLAYERQRNSPNYVMDYSQPSGNAGNEQGANANS